jgi:hypothetical protein
MRRRIGLVILLGLAVVAFGACGGNPCNGLPEEEGIACAENYQAP